jgi:N-acetylglucosaminyldiphosphoundecaprenol N-acetyl-beta-D-mannosaminyltransferase
MQTQPTERRINFLGCPLDLLTSAKLLEELTTSIDSRTAPRVIQFVNANKVAQVRDDAQMEKIMWRADYSLADGQPLLPMGRMLGVKIPERIDGIGLMGKLLCLANQRGYSVYLLGAKQEVVEACIERIRRELPNVKIAGYRNGYFTSKDAAEIVHQVHQAQPDMLFLGMGSPMKERFADQYAKQLGAAVIQGVGGSFDVMAGLVKRAPGWMQRVGIEWLYRIVQEPRRMFWRYTKTNGQCLWAFACALVSPANRRAKRAHENYMEVPAETLTKM